MPCHLDDDAVADGGTVQFSIADEPGSSSGQNDEAPAHGDRARPRKLHPALRSLLRAGPDHERVALFLSRNRFPLIDREAVTFAFEGEADAVYLHHFMRGIPGGLPFERVPGTNLWHLRLPVPKNSRFEYKFDVVRDGQGTWINDPRNPLHATDPFGANSVGQSHGYAAPGWTQHDPAVPAGRVEWMPIESRAFGETRDVGVYLPAGYTEDRDYPLVVLHDGADFLDHAGLKTALDNLVHRGEAPPFLGVLTRPGERNGEYTGDPRHGDFLSGEVLPLARERFSIRPGQRNSVLMGSSLGAVASLATAFHHPGVFGALALMSGSFIFDRDLLQDRDPLFGRVAELVDLVRSDPARLPKRIFVGCGVYEGLISQNRILVRFLRKHGAEVRFLETRDGHHWHNWRDQLQAALNWTLPPQP